MAISLWNTNMKRLIIHLGFHKTGSTFLQSSLHGTARKSKNPGFINNWFVTNAASTLSGSQIRDLRAGRFNIDVTDALRAHLTEQDCDCILSNENLIGNQFGQKVDYGFYPDTTNLTTFFDGLGDLFDILYVFYVRRQDNFISSTYLNIARGGYSGQFTDYMARFDFDDLDYDSFFTKLKQSTKNPIKVVPFEIIRTSPERFISSFTDLFSPNATISHSSNQRTSLSAIGIDLYQSVGHKLNDKDRAVLARFLANKFSTKTHPPKQLLPKYLSRLMLKDFSERNRALFKNHIDESYHDVLGYYVGE